MSEKTTPICEYGQNAYDFSLSCTNEKIWTLDNLKGERGLLIFFICNHCPFVKAILPKLVRATNTLVDHGINSVGIMSNDPSEYNEDSFENMHKIAVKNKFSFPYLYDETQQVARAYDAACTPDFYIFDKNQKLVYRGQLDDSRPENGIPVTGKDMQSALDSILNHTEISATQKPSIGCNIKWKN